MKSKKITISSVHIIMASFLAIILIGTIILSLPICSANGENTSFIDSLFTATTSTCVTGLVVVPTVSHWSILGQVVILLLIQVGGLGLITVTTGIAVVMHKKIGLSDRLLLQDAFNLNTLSGLGEFVRKVIKGTAIVEGIGALLYMTVFIPQYGLKGIWYSVFTSVSAFCNAGIDIFANDSLCQYVNNPIINFTTIGLIVAGGIGYIVWWDLIRIVKSKKSLRNLTLHSKIAISSTIVLILAGAMLVFMFEYSNSNTMKDFTVLEKIQASLFQSVTTRTAGFFTIPQENFTNSSSTISLLLMFIGGSPVGTAGGVKTVTITLLVLSAINVIRNKDRVEIFNRSIDRGAVSKAVAVVCMSFTIMFVSTVLLSAVTNAQFLDILYETVSATATVGLSRNLTSQLNVYGKFIIILTMYLGRVGPISLAIAFKLKKDNPNLIKCPTEEISVG